jgi:hypothetical protein
MDDRELELKVRDRYPCDLEAAFKAAIRVETHLKAYNADRDRENVREVGNRRERYKDDRVQQVARELEPARSRRVEVDDENSTRLWAQLERKQRENDELSKELGRLKLLAEQAKSVAQLSNVEPQAESGAPSQSRQFLNQPPAAARRGWTDDRSCFRCGAKGHGFRFCPKPISDVNKPTAGNYPRNGGQASEEKKENTQAKVDRGATTDDVCTPAYLKLLIGDTIAYALLDSGAEIKLIPTANSKGMHLEPYACKVYAANGTEICIRCIAEFCAYVDGALLHLTGLVSDHECDVILGLELFMRAGSCLKFLTVEP